MKPLKGIEGVEGLVSGQKWRSCIPEKGLFPRLALFRRETLELIAQKTETRSRGVGGERDKRM